jgi:Osmosensitive K+ channel histidine kinase
MRLKTRRILVVILAFIVYIALLVHTTLSAMMAGGVPYVAVFLSALSAFAFFAIGSFVWLYASDRRVAVLLLGFCLTLMVTFSVENRPIADRILVCLGEIGSVGAILFLSDLLTLFPGHSGIAVATDERSRFVKGTLIISSVLGCLLIAFSIYATFIVSRYAAWILTANHIFFAIELAIILARLTIFFFRSATRRDRQQIFLFVWGLVITAAPLLFLTLLPLLFNFNYLSPHMSAVALSLFPLALGYSILRYQILVFDTHVRRAVSVIAGIVFVLVCVVIIVALSNHFILPLFSHTHLGSVKYLLYLLLVTCCCALISPCIWWLARWSTEHLFFSEILYYQRVLDEPSVVTDEVISTDDAANLIASAAVHTFNALAACVFIFDERDGLFVLQPPLEDQPRDTTRRMLLTSLQRVISPLSAQERERAAFRASAPLFARLTAARRPLLLSEALRPIGDEPIGVRRYLTVGSPLGLEDWLLAPLRAQGKVIGLLVLGERGDRQPYAGPDMEATQWLLSRFSPVLEAARLYARAHQNAVLLNRLYHVSMMPSYAFKTIDDAARIYAHVAAESTAAVAEIWLSEDKHRLRRAAVVDRVGNFDVPSSLLASDTLMLVRVSDWQPYFFQGGDSASIKPDVKLPSCLPLPPSWGFAWLPLQRDARRLGILMIVYQGYHSFAREEIRVLEMFAQQCVATLENVRMTSELVQYNERLQVVDHLKDQFMTTASHELRTPLTAVAGYIELLSQFKDKEDLSEETRAEFLEKARRGCDELTLLINNITDASQVEVEVERMRLRSISLAAPIAYMLEIMETTLNDEQRQVNVSLCPDVLVVADEIRLRQVLLNLLSNALKYSEPGTAITISSEIEGQFVFVAVRDYGKGIPPGGQQDIFERFVRMERDMNSPVRGAGLGLYICRQLIEAMGGWIWVESSGQAGEGSCFMFSLRLASAQCLSIPGSVSD